MGSVAADISVGFRFGLGARKRRRVHPPVENDQQDAGTMDAHTVVFGPGPEGDVHAGYAWLLLMSYY